MQKKILVFGTFDGIHPGHEFFLRSAKSRGSFLHVAVARDSHIEELKDRKPRNRELKRKEAIEVLPYVDEASLSDEELGTFNIIHLVNPDKIILGHDQHDLEKALIKWMQEHDHYIPMMKIKKI